MGIVENSTVVGSWNEGDPLKHVIVGIATGAMLQAPEPAVQRDWPEYGLPLGTHGLLSRKWKTGPMSRWTTLRPCGGGLHCTTADVYREGTLEDYFPRQIPGY